MNAILDNARRHLDHAVRWAAAVAVAVRDVEAVEVGPARGRPAVEAFRQALRDGLALVDEALDPAPPPPAPAYGPAIACRRHPGMFCWGVTPPHAACRAEADAAPEFLPAQDRHERVYDLPSPHADAEVVCSCGAVWWNTGDPDGTFARHVAYEASRP